MSKLKERLESLYRLAKLSDEETKLLEANKLDDARLNEVRTASFLLLHTARIKGVQVKFVFSGEEKVRDKGSSGTRPFQTPVPGDLDDFFGDFVRSVQEATNARQAQEKKRIRQEARESEERRARAKYGSVDDVFGRPWPVDPGPVSVDPGPFERPPPVKKQRSNSDTEVPRIKSKYEGRCSVCMKMYKINDEVWWIRGVGCSHVACGYEDLQKVASGV